jgi:hypothetical protein
VHPLDYSRQGERDGVTDGSGTFVANFAISPKYTMKTADQVIVYCMLSSGDSVIRVFVVP